MLFDELANTQLPLSLPVLEAKKAGKGAREPGAYPPVYYLHFIYRSYISLGSVLTRLGLAYVLPSYRTGKRMWNIHKIYRSSVVEKAQVCIDAKPVAVMSAQRGNAYSSTYTLIPHTGK